MKFDTNIERAMALSNYNNINCYSLYSHSLGCLNVPFFASDDESAIRSIIDLVASGRDAAILYGVLGGDLELHKLGDFDYKNLNVFTPTVTAFNCDLVDRCCAVRKDLKKFVIKEESEDK